MAEDALARVKAERERLNHEKKNRGVRDAEQRV